MGAIFGFSGLSDKRLIRRMSKSLNKRAPDGFRSHLDQDFCFGQGIYKLGKDYCPKPLTNENGDIVLICDGRIFQSEKYRNELEKRGHEFSTDFSGEVILHLYEEIGMNFINWINGDFTFAIIDKGKLILCTDHSGSKPLYYFQNNKEIIFSSEIKSILKYENNIKSFNHKFIDIFLTYFFYQMMKHFILELKR